jgi:hypothetical protein
LAGLAVTAGIAGLLTLQPAVPSDAAGPDQPIAFSHALHAGAGPDSQEPARNRLQLDCLYCHADARRSAYAGIPSVRRCMGCHLISGAQKPEVQKIHQYWKDGEPIPWVRIHKVPGFVHFPHKRHVQAGLRCQECHGEVQDMAVVAQAAPLTMGWCVECHARRSGPLDCLACHH